MAIPSSCYFSAPCSLSGSFLVYLPSPEHRNSWSQSRSAASTETRIEPCSIHIKALCRDSSCHTGKARRQWRTDRGRDTWVSSRERKPFPGETQIPGDNVEVEASVRVASSSLHCWVYRDTGKDLTSPPSFLVRHLLQ